MKVLHLALLAMTWEFMDRPMELSYLPPSEIPRSYPTIGKLTQSHREEDPVSPCKRRPSVRLYSVRLTRLSFKPLILCVWGGMSMGAHAAAPM